jgi:uncharacterized protein (TIGR00661 family)
MKILYCLAGEGMGHCTRSLEIIRHLSKKHKVRVMASAVSYRFLRNKVRNLHRILGYNLVYRNNNLSFLLTTLLNVVKWPFVELYNLKFVKHMVNFKPDIIISDFEPYSSWWGLITGKPVLTIDNQQVVKTDLRVKKRFGLFFLRSFINAYIPKRTKSLALSFFKTKVRDKKTILAPPVLRKDVLETKPKRKDFIMVYQTSRDYDRLLKTLHCIDEDFVIPDSRHRGKVQNVTFQGFSEKNFLNDLSECKAIITNGGFSLISEALYFKKPILSEPIRGQFEQYINAYHIQKLGFGKFCKKIDAKCIRDFVSNLNHYKRNLEQNYRQTNNDKFFRILDKTLDSLS